MRRTPLAAAAGAAALALGPIGAPAADAALERGREHFARGAYDEAREALEATGGDEAREAALALVRLDMREGAWEEAGRRADELAETAAADDTTDAIAERARVLGAEVDWRTGAPEDARQALQAVAARGDDLRGRYLLGRVLLDLGESQRADAHFDALIEDWNDGAIDHGDAEALMYMALAARRLESFRDANDTFRDAVALDPELHEANIAWGHLFLENHAADSAEESFDDVLQIDPHHPDAHAGMARVRLATSYDVGAATRHLEEAFAVDPNHVPSLRVRAELAIDRQDWEEAHAALDAITEVNPRSLRARALRAAIHWMRDQPEAFAEIEEEVLRDNPAYARLYRTAARSAMREHRYPEAIDLYERAVDLDPLDSEAMQGIGTAHLRLGDEAEGLTWLRRAWEGDEYDARTYNTLELFEETIPGEYQFAAADSAVFRYHDDEKALLRRYVEPVVDRAYADMAERYGYEPDEPIIIELFRDREDYSVRTTGLPNLGAHAVSFGRVITAVSPTLGEANWAMVLWHELAHAFAMQISDARVPRWYTEGLAEYETLRARPEWRRAHDADLFAALEADELPSVTELDREFARPARGEIWIAYHHAALVIEFLARERGFDEVVRGLELFGDGLETSDVIREIADREPDAFDDDFRRYLRARLSPYEGTFQLPIRALGDTRALDAAVRERPEDPDAHARLGLGHVFGGNARAARDAARRALALDGDHPLAHFVAGELAMRRGRYGAAERRYRAVLEEGGESFDARARLGAIAAERGDAREAERHYCEAKRLDPERAVPYRALWRLYRERGRDEAALRALEGYVMRDPHALAPARELAEGYGERGAWEKARAYGELGREIDLSDARIHLVLGEAYLQTGAPERARRSFESAVLADPAREGAARLGEARALRAQGEIQQARAAAEDALAADPESEEARALLDEL